MQGRNKLRVAVNILGPERKGRAETLLVQILGANAAVTEPDERPSEIHF